MIIPCFFQLIPVQIHSPAFYKLVTQTLLVQSCFFTLKEMGCTATETLVCFKIAYVFSPEFKEYFVFWSHQLCIQFANKHCKVTHSNDIQPTLLFHC